VFGTMADLESFLAAHRDSILEQFLEFVRVPAVAVEGGPEIRRMAGLVAAKCREAGLTTRVVETPGHPIVYAHGGPQNGSFTLLTYGHYDVFPVAGQAGWSTDPFRPVIRGDRVYARGAGDNKGQFLAYLNALQWWQRQAGGLPIRVKVILEGEEEDGSRHLPRFVEHHGEELAADLCVYSDGPLLPGDRPALLFGARGAVALEFHAAGAAVPLHSGNFGGVAPNPILDLSRLFAELVAPNGDLAVPALRQGLPEVTAAERAALDRLDFDPAEFRERTGIESLPTRFGESYYERLLYRPSLNLSGITGGYCGPGVRSLIPASATAKADLRLVGRQDPDDAVAAIRGFVAERGYTGIEVRQLFGQPPSRTPVDHPYADLVERAVADAFQVAPTRVPSLAGTTPDHVFTRQLGIPAILVPLAPADENHHGPNESMKLSLFFRGIRLVAHLIEVLAAADPRR
jgi:acetylornithine deacetylase/succinyl-diaminopimelate desuccinylase-like protein